MDELDANLLEAWDVVRAGLAKDPAAAGRRYERGLRSALRRPVRAWCVSVKASDTRIEHEAFWDADAAAAAERRERHRVVLFGSLVRHLVRPVVIAWPGLRVEAAARQMGIDERTMIDWVDKGWVLSRKEKVPGQRGLASRFVWTGGGGVDVCFPQGRDARWGSLWQSLWRRVPEGFEQTVERVPRVRPDRGNRTQSNAGAPPEDREKVDDGFRGWDWVCPGRVLADGTEAGCGRVCKKLVAPLPVWTIARAFGPPPEDCSRVGLEGSAAGVWGVADYEPRRVRFACGRCWDVQHQPRDPDAAWNQLVTAISGGWLYGREVARPAT
ncbi:MAG: hypothetical protein AAF086_03070 [Planctomycetota bacterium]